MVSIYNSRLSQCQVLDLYLIVEYRGGRYWIYKQQYIIAVHVLVIYVTVGYHIDRYLVHM